MATGDKKRTVDVRLTISDVSAVGHYDPKSKTMVWEEERTEEIIILRAPVTGDDEFDGYPVVAAA